MKCTVYWKELHYMYPQQYVVILVINSYYCFQDKRRERNIYFTLINDEEVITDKHVIAILM